LQLSNSSHIKKADHSSNKPKNLEELLAHWKARTLLKSAQLLFLKTNEYITGEQLKLDQVIGV